MKRRILLVTERRADYSKFKPILAAIKHSKKTEYKLIVTGTHLLKSHGHTIDEIKQDGFKVTTNPEISQRNKKLVTLNTWNNMKTKPTTPKLLLTYQYLANEVFHLNMELERRANPKKVAPDRAKLLTRDPANSPGIRT